MVAWGVGNPIGDIAVEHMSPVAVFVIEMICGLLNSGRRCIVHPITTAGNQTHTVAYCDSIWLAPAWPGISIGQYRLAIWIGNNWRNFDV